MVSSPTASQGCNSGEKQDAVSRDIHSQQGGACRTAGAASGCGKTSQTGAPHTLPAESYSSFVLLERFCRLSSFICVHLTRKTQQTCKDLDLLCMFEAGFGPYLAEIFQSLTPCPGQRLHTLHKSQRTSFYSRNPVRS